MGGNAEGRSYALLALARPRHRGDTVGGQPPLPTVSYVRHDGAVAVPERAEPSHIAVQEVK